MLKITRNLSLTPSENYCRNLVLKHDRENFTGGFLLNKDHQRAYYALRALNVTLATSTEKVRDENLARSRLEFWKNEISNDSNSTPMSEEVMYLKKQKKIPKYWLNQLVKSRMDRLEYGTQYRPFKTIKDLDSFSDKTHGIIIQCMLKVLNEQNVVVDKDSQQIARMIGFTQQLRATHYYAHMRHVVLPLDLLKHHKVDVRKLMLGGRNTELVNFKELEELVFDLSSRAVGLITLTRKNQDKIYKKNKDLRKLFTILIAPSEMWLKNLEKVQFDIFSKELQKRNDSLALELAKRVYWTRKI